MMMSMKSEYESLLIDTKEEFPDFEIIAKQNSFLMKTIDVALKIITFGQMKAFMTGFITTLGQKVYVHDKWRLSPYTNKCEVIRHERVHMRQAKRHGRFLFSLMYLVIPLPTVFAYYRRKFEQEAYEETLRAVYEYRGVSAFTPQLKESIIAHFTSSQYFWMWPWRKDIEKWYDASVKKIKSNILDI